MVNRRRLNRRKESWFSTLINASDPTRDVKLLAFAVVVAFSIGWLTGELVREKMSDQWVNAFYGLCALVGLGGSAWAWVDKQKSKEQKKDPE